MRNALYIFKKMESKYPLIIQGFELNQLNGATTSSVSTNGTISQGRGNGKWFDLLERSNFSTRAADAATASVKIGNQGMLQNVLARTMSSHAPMSQHEYYPIDAVPGQTWQVQFQRGAVGTTLGLTNFHLHIYYENPYDNMQYRCKLSNKPHLYRQDLIWEIGSTTIYNGAKQTVQPGNGYVKAIQLAINYDILDLTDTIITVNVNGVAVILNALASLFAMYGTRTVQNRTAMRFPIYIEPNTDIDISVTQLTGTRSYGALVTLSLIFSGCEE
jgi:hypothetical protein